MDKIISAAEANRRFSQLLRAVRDGDSYVVTAHGKPVAKIILIRSDDRVRAAAHVALLEHLRSQTPIDIGPWTREQLHDLLAAADARLDAETLDAIDELVPPGTLVDEGDRGFDPWWFETKAQRRT